VAADVIMLLADVASNEAPWQWQDETGSAAVTHVDSRWVVEG
jgi:hypothetical protein